jgi:hypothetical protein
VASITRRRGELAERLWDLSQTALGAVVRKLTGMCAG